MGEIISDSDSIQVKGVLPVDEMMEQLSPSTISFSTISKLSLNREREKTQTNIVSRNKVFTDSTISSSSYTNISTNEKSHSRISNSSNVWTNQRRVN